MPVLALRLRTNESNVNLLQPAGRCESSHRPSIAVWSIVYALAFKLSPVLLRGPVMHSIDYCTRVPLPPLCLVCTGWALEVFLGGRVLVNLYDLQGRTSSLSLCSLLGLLLPSSASLSSPPSPSLPSVSQRTMADEGEAPPVEWSGALNDDGVPTGDGTMTYPDGASFEGTLVDGVKQGAGTYKYADGATVYEGGFENNLKSGKGTLSFANGDKYEGDFKDGTMEGYGEMAYASGDMYFGSFKAGKKDGEGSYHFKSASCEFTGTWSEGEFVKGDWIHKDGTVYRGSFANGKPTGVGVYHFVTVGTLQTGEYDVNGNWKGGTISPAPA